MVRLKEVFKEELEIPIQKLPLLPVISIDEEATLKEVYLLMQKNKMSCSYKIRRPRWNHY